MRFTPPELIKKQHNRSEFDCSSNSLNIFLKRYALQNQKKNISRTYVALDAKKVIGFYSLVAGSVSQKTSPDELTKGIGQYDVPVIILARLAVDKNYGDQGIGSGLLKDALLRVLQASSIIGARALIIHAKDSQAKKFYKQFGFKDSPTDPLHLYLPISSIEASL